MASCPRAMFNWLFKKRSKTPPEHSASASPRNARQSSPAPPPPSHSLPPTPRLNTATAAQRHGSTPRPPTGGNQSEACAADCGAGCRCAWSPPPVFRGGTPTPQALAADAAAATERRRRRSQHSRQGHGHGHGHGHSHGSGSEHTTSDTSSGGKMRDDAHSQSH